MLRGHIRDSFKTRDLYDFIKGIYDRDTDLKIFIHTWNVFANNLSWRQILTNDEIVNEDKIYNYFDDLSNCIKHIIIDDDKKIKLIGNLHGTISKNNPMPILGWKNYWYGQFKIINYIVKQNYNDEPVVNVRIDVLNNSNSFRKNHIIQFIKNNSSRFFKKNRFLFRYERIGIDNIYIGNSKTMYKLIHKFHHDLDTILKENDVDNLDNHEKLVYRVNEKIFTDRFKPSH